MKKLMVVFLFLSVILIIGVTGCDSPGEDAGVWDEIQETGVLKVGTSADYPPWEYVDEAGEFVGYDMDLIRLIGDHMGVEVEITDISFEALIAAVKEGRIHAAIACMNATPERKEQVAFSDPYWSITSTPVISTDAEFTIDSIEDVFGLVIGVQTGTTEEEWLNEQVEAGNIDEGDLFRYERNDQAMMDLVAGRLDAVFIDASVGKSFSRTMDVQTTVEEDLSGYPLGIALVEGDAELLAAVNAAIADLIEQGVMEELAEQHLVFE